MPEKKESPPVLDGIILCDQIIEDRLSGKKSIIGIFQEILAAKFPCVHPCMWIYAAISDAEGDFEFELRLLEGESLNRISSSRTSKIRIANRLQRTEIQIRMDGLPLKKPGQYVFQILANGELMAEKPFYAREVQRPNN
ncbi:MAG: hypothetical protein HY292_09020 [Planctomycetes bacterium]|nr:hypothetical protein [Planctomycetota bacterium]